MTMYREILRLRDEGKVSQRDIAASCGCAHSTVKRVLARSRELGLSFETVKEKTDEQIMRLLFPKKLPRNIHQEPDYAEMHRELSKSGVTITQLTPEQRKAFKDATRPVFDKWAATIGKDLVKKAETAIAAAK